MAKRPNTIRMLQVASQPSLFYCFLRPLVFELMRRGVEVNVACNSGDQRFDELGRIGMKTIPLTVGSWNCPRTWWTLCRELREVLSRKEYDICVVHTPAMSWITRRQAARAGIPVVAYMAHGLPFFDRQGPLVYRTMLAVEKFCARYTDLLLVINSVDAAAAQQQRLIKPGGLVRHIPGSGIDLGRWQNKPAEQQLAALRRELSIGSDTRIITYMGRLIDSKGVLDLIKVLARLVETGRDVVLVVAGQGPLTEAMAKRAAEQRLVERVRLLGWRDRDYVAELMFLTDVLVLPSTYREGLPTVLIEAGAARKPVVAYRNRGSDDVIVDGQTGFSVPGHDVAALTDAIARLLDDRDLARRMGEAGYERVRSTFSFAQGVQAQLDAYAEALRQKGIDASLLDGPPGEPIFSLADGDKQGEGEA